MGIIGEILIKAIEEAEHEKADFNTVIVPLLMAAQAKAENSIRNRDKCSDGKR